MRPACAWGMEAGITSYHGDRFGEFCCNPTVKDQIVCAQDRCDAKVHRLCQWAWLKKARLPFVVPSPIFARPTIYNAGIILDVTSGIVNSLFLQIFLRD